MSLQMTSDEKKALLLIPVILAVIFLGSIAFPTAFLGLPLKQLRWLAVVMVGARGSGAKTAVPALERIVITDEDWGVRSAAASALGRIGPDAREAVPTLIRSIRSDKNYPVRSSSEEALIKIGPEARPALEEAERLESDEEARNAFRRALEKIPSAR